MASEKVIVVFRKFRDGDVIALFPAVPYDTRGVLCQSYMHVGQHGAAEYHQCMQMTVPAQSAEYAALLHELTSKPYGYQFDIRKRYMVKR